MSKYSQLTEEEIEALYKPVSAPTLKSAPEAPTYDTTSWDDTQKGKDAGAAYDDAKDKVLNYGDFTYGNQEQLNAIMDKILNREKFSYDLNGDALYQQYKDKYIQHGKLAMGDAIGQASAMTGGYGNSYAQSVGQQAYQGQLDNLNDIVPQLYQMALDKYNMDEQSLFSKYGMLTDDYDRAYGVHKDGYNQLLDELGIAKSDYYDGANMFYTEQDNKNTVASNEFDDAMSIVTNDNTNAWNEANWKESNRRYEVENMQQEAAAAKIPTFTSYDTAYKYMIENGVSDEAISGIADKSDWEKMYAEFEVLKKNVPGMEALLIEEYGIDPAMFNYSNYYEYLNDMVDLLITTK